MERSADTDEDPPVQVWKEMLVPIKNPFHQDRFSKEEYIPRILYEMSGPRNRKKKDLANRVLVDWQCSTRRKKVKEGECPFYQPATQNIQLRTFMAKLKDCYSFEFSLVDFKKFKGSLGSVVKELYSQRLEEWVSERKK